MKKAQVQTSFYLTQNLRDLSRFLHKREEITKVVFYRRALKAQIEELALEKNYTEGQIIFMAIVDYCTLLLSIDSTGVSI